MDRRKFFKVTLTAAAGLALEGQADDALASSHITADLAKEHPACLVDTTLCIGCRKCEEACNKANGLPPPEFSFSDRNVFRERRRPMESRYTVVNQYPGAPSPDQKQKAETYAKVQCMHCLDPACVSACIVGALHKSKEGPVVYNPDICIGCRYCMISCPFEIPAYEFSNPVKPRVRKCQFCTDNARGPHANPACAAACPMEAILFGKRGELLEVARKRIADRPDRYINHIYGETEVGGTSWLYLMGRPQEEIDLLDLPKEAPPRKTEAIQHGIFKFGIAPIAVYGALGGIMWATRRREALREAEEKRYGDEGGDR